VRAGSCICRPAMVFTMDRNRSASSVSICFADHCSDVTLGSTAIVWFSFES
jgi:hypothetical protein